MKREPALWIHLPPGGKANLFDFLAFKAGRGAAGAQAACERRPAFSAARLKKISQVHSVLQALLPCSVFG